jgi:hypothetical protein
LALEDTEVARIKPADDLTSDPLAWFRVVRRPETNEAETVHVYGHAEAISDRPWLGRAPTIAGAVAFCDHLERTSTETGDYD